MTVRTNCARSEHPHYSILAHLTDDLSYVAFLKNQNWLTALLIRFKYSGDSSFTVNLLDKLHCKIHHRQCGRPAWKLRMGREIEGERFLSMIWNLNLDSYGRHPCLSQRGEGPCHMSKKFSSNNSLESLLEQVNALLHKEKSCMLKYFQEYFLTAWHFFHNIIGLHVWYMQQQLGFCRLNIVPNQQHVRLGSLAHQMLFH